MQVAVTEGRVVDAEWAAAIGSNTHGPDFKWVLAARAGYTLAFEELMARNERRVYRLAFAITGSPRDAGIVLQDTFVKAYEHLHEFRGNCRFSVWILGIAAKEALRRVREVHGERFVFDQFVTAEETKTLYESVPWGDPKKHSTRSELEQIVYVTLGALTPLCRAILLLYDVEGCSSDEVAEFCGLSPHVVKCCLPRTRQALRERVNRVFNSGLPERSDYTISSLGGRKEIDNGTTISSTAT